MRRDYLTRRNNTSISRLRFLSLCLIPVSSFLRISVCLCFGNSSLRRKQNVETYAFRQRRQHFIGDGLWRIFINLASANAAVGDAYARVEQAKIVEHFSLSTDS